MSSPRTYKTKGIVLKSIDLNEADKIITIFSKDSGKISAIAKGIRKTGSKFGARLEPFTYVDLFIHKGRSLDIITQAEIISPFLKIKADFDKITYGLAILDLIDKVSQEGEVNRNLFTLFISALETLDLLDKNVELFYVAFQLKLMAVSGYLPRFSSCVSCHTKFDDLENLRFSFEGGGIICLDCGLADSFAYSISKNAFCVLGELTKANREKIIQSQISDETLKEISSLMKKYVNYHLGFRVKSFEYMEKIQNVRCKT